MHTYQRQIGTDTYGNPVLLGTTDSDGEHVGWIHPTTGDAYRDRREYYCATALGRYTDAYNDWRRAGRVGPEPQPEPYALAYGGAYYDDALTHCLDGRWLLRMVVAERGR